MKAGTLMAGTKEHAHELIERLAPRQVSAVVGLLEAMLDPVSLAIANAPLDDEPLTAEEEKALAEAREWSKHNQGIPHEQVLAELGITQEEIDRFKEAK
jgi:Spy/CpxP family protein refolding chaperone